MKNTNEALDLNLSNNELVFASEEKSENYSINYNEYNYKEYYMNIIKAWNIRRPRLVSNILH